jgi:hypothetical protein
MKLFFVVVLLSIINLVLYKCTTFANIASFNSGIVLGWIVIILIAIWPDNTFSANNYKDLMK